MTHKIAVYKRNIPCKVCAGTVFYSDDHKCCRCVADKKEKALKAMEKRALEYSLENKALKEKRRAPGAGRRSRTGTKISESRNYYFNSNDSKSYHPVKLGEWPAGIAQLHGENLNVMD